jgi:hypothetical protein
MARPRRPDLARKAGATDRINGRITGRSTSQGTRQGPGQNERRMPAAYAASACAPAARLLRTTSAALLGGWVGVVLDALLQRPSAARAHGSGRPDRSTR